MSNFQFALIIPAAGAGSRMGKNLPKPYLTVAGKTILEHTVERFAGVPGLRQLVIVTSESHFSQTMKIIRGVEDLHEDVKVSTVKGGAERQDSIANALSELIDEIELVAIHDAVRPFVDRKDIVNCLNKAGETGAAILAIPVQDTVKKVDDKLVIQQTPDRRFLWQAQTPQIFKKELITEAYKFAENSNFSGTDDASLVEYFGGRVSVVEGSRDNFKITYPLDLEVAELLLQK
ncbi:MAG: 2-C-methyl-D-erythritol 4-phosphate cytidylyltransferase [Balneolaceae bacterium]